jgi:hypothetical protein
MFPPADPDELVRVIDRCLASDLYGNRFTQRNEIRGTTLWRGIRGPESAT